MTMVSSGAISVGGNATCGSLNRSINIELGLSATAQSSLNCASFRTLAGVPSGAISLSNFYGKSNNPYMVVTTSGASVVTSGNYKIATYTSSGTFTVTAVGPDPTEGNKVTAVVVAGGGGGGNGGTNPSGGGGGAGGMLESTLTITATTYTVTVGAGGAGICSNFGTVGNDGTSSAFGGLSSTTGGGGGGAWVYNGCTTVQFKGRNGGSGGGGSGYGCNSAGGTAVSGQGNAGGVGNLVSCGAVQGGGGGGGASAVGGISSGYSVYCYFTGTLRYSAGGNGGAGRATTISGSSVTYAGGGGGAMRTDITTGGGLGGVGGGGRGGVTANTNIASTAGSVNTGGGGGAGSYPILTSQRAKAGGSGIVIVKWRFQ